MWKIFVAHGRRIKKRNLWHLCILDPAREFNKKTKHHPLCISIPLQWNWIKTKWNSLGKWDVQNTLTYLPLYTSTQIFTHKLSLKSIVSSMNCQLEYGSYQNEANRVVCIGCMRTLWLNSIKCKEMQKEFTALNETTEAQSAHFIL